MTIHENLDDVDASGSDVVGDPDDRDSHSMCLFRLHVGLLHAVFADAWLEFWVSAAARVETLDC